jgi:hypothetical protein
VRARQEGRHMWQIKKRKFVKQKSKKFKTMQEIEDSSTHYFRLELQSICLKQKMANFDDLEHS